MGLPIPDLDDKTFDEMIREARSLITRFSRNAPEWTDHNIHDPGVTFIELFAWLAEMQMYRINRVTDAQYRAFFNLIGLAPRGVRPARVDITFEPAEEDIKIGDKITTKAGDRQIVYEAEEEVALVPGTLKKVISIHDSRITDHTRSNGVEDGRFAPFGEKAPEGAELRLGFDASLPEKDVRITFDAAGEEQSRDVDSGRGFERIFPSADVQWEYLGRPDRWRPLTLEKDTTLALARSGKIAFIGPSLMEAWKSPIPGSGMEQFYWIRCRLKKRGHEIAPMLKRIRLNTVSAVQIETVENEELENGTGRPGQRVMLAKSPVFTEAEGALVLQVRSGKWKTWERVNDFRRSCPNDCHYTLDPEKGEITFGNGLNGAIPPKSAGIRAARYKTTLGPGGVVSKGGRWRLPKNSAVKGKNLKDTVGAAAAETIEEAKARARKELRTRYRAVTSDDYEKLALETPGVRVVRAKALPNHRPDFPFISAPGAVTVAVVPEVGDKRVKAEPSEGFRKTVASHLDRRRIITTDLHVTGPEYIRIDVHCKVKAKKKCDCGQLDKRVRTALETFLHPLKGGPDGKGWPFGRSVYPSEIYQLIDKVEGVDYVTDVEIEAKGKSVKPGKSPEPIKIPRAALVYSGNHRITPVGT